MSMLKLLARISHVKRTRIPQLNADGSITKHEFVYIPRFKWVGPVTGWKDCDLDRIMTGRFVWNWGLMVFGFLTYQPILGWAYREAKDRISAWFCILIHKEHKFVGPIGICERCGYN